jgi:acetyl-CoA carboxylase biotin carboxylase subunit
VTSALFPAGPGIRVDTHVQADSGVPPYYDSLLAKLIVSGADRAEALARLGRALELCEITGVTTNLAMHVALSADDEFAAGGVDTGYLGRWLERAPRSVRTVLARGDTAPPTEDPDGPEPPVAGLSSGARRG